MENKAITQCKGECRFVAKKNEDGAVGCEALFADANDIIERMCGANAPDDIAEKMRKSFEILPFGDIVDGSVFADWVKTGCVTDYDGSLGVIVVNGYMSNLGIFAEDFYQGGDFLVTLEVFLDICNKYDVQVLWFNR